MCNGFIVTFKGIEKYFLNLAALIPNMANIDIYKYRHIHISYINKNPLRSQ